MTKRLFWEKQANLDEWHAYIWPKKNRPSLDYWRIVRYSDTYTLYKVVDGQNGGISRYSSIISLRDFDQIKKVASQLQKIKRLDVEKFFAEVHEKNLKEGK